MVDDQNESVTPEAESEPQDLRSVLASAVDAQEAAPVEVEAEEAPRSRDSAGRFTVAATPAEEKQPPAEAVSKPAVRAPSSWRKDAAAAFEKIEAGQPLSPDDLRLIRDEALRRETDFHKGIEGFKTHADLGRSMERTLQPYAATMQQLGVPPDVAVDSLLRADAGLRHGTPEQKLQHLAHIAQSYGIDIGQLSQVPQRDPYTFKLEQQLNEIRQQQERFQRAQLEQQQEALHSDIQAFAATAEHFEAVHEDMAALLQAGRAKDLQDAYEKAVYANPQTRQALLEQQRQDALKQAQKQTLSDRAKAAAVSVRGSSPASGSSAAPTSLRAALEAAYGN